MFDSHFEIKNIPLNLERTLNSGQAFCWLFMPDLQVWSGWINNKPCYLKQIEKGIEDADNGRVLDYKIVKQKFYDKWAK